MVAAFSLVKDFGATQESVANVMACSQGTIANWVKEVSYKKEIHGLQSELNGARKYIDELASELNLIEFKKEKLYKFFNYKEEKKWLTTQKTTK